jgi:hypothetical protein
MLPVCGCFAPVIIRDTSEKFPDTNWRFLLCQHKRLFSVLKKTFSTQSTLLIDPLHPSVDAKKLLKAVAEVVLYQKVFKSHVVSSAQRGCSAASKKAVGVGVPKGNFIFASFVDRRWYFGLDDKYDAFLYIDVISSKAWSPSPSKK